jgi:hypothetical protein
MEDDKKYMTNGVTYSERQTSERTNWLRVEMFAFANGGSHELGIKVYTYENAKQEIHFKGTLNELIELVLLGKLYKEQLQAEIKLCDLCGKPTTGQNPHYDCTQQEAYAALDRKLHSAATDIRELQNNA